jgi:pimeloyl-ACP methyl ester carboxylesterase
MTVAAVALLLLHLSGAAIRNPSPLDTLVEAGGYHMHLVVYRGAKPLTIVLESGGGASLGAWSGVEVQLAARTGATVVAYDRAGFGTSGTGPADLTPRQQVEQLDAVLDRLGTPPERIVIGTSYGGLMAVLHAHRYPGKVRGLVLVDPMNPRFVQATGDFIYSTVPRIEHPASPRDTALARLVSTFDGLVRDPDAGDAGLTIPFVIITAGEPWFRKDHPDRSWRASHEAMARAAPGRRLIVAEGSDHAIAAKRPDTIIDAALSLTDGRRDGR